MSQPRADVIRRLVHAATTGMTAVAQGSTEDEVVSACFSVANNALHVAKERGADMRVIQQVLQQMLMECGDSQVM